MEERWLPTVGFFGYEVSDFGRVRSFWHHVRVPGCHGGSSSIIGTTPKILKLQKSKKDGYLRVGFRRGSVRGSTIHRLVLEAFVGLRPVGMEARHLDGNKDNCFLANLAWGTPVENEADKVKHGTICRGETSGTSKLKESDVIEIIRLSKTTTLTYREIGKLFGVSATPAYQAAVGITWAHINRDVEQTAFRRKRKTNAN